MSQVGPNPLMAALCAILPTKTELEAVLPKEPPELQQVPFVDDRMAAPFRFEWRDGVLDKAVFEIYDVANPLWDISARAYRTFLKRPESATTRCLALGNVACNDFYNSQLLGDAVELLAREGLPPNLECLQFERLGPVTNAGDLGYYETESLKPLLPKLGNLKELEIASCESLGKFDLPQLRSLRIHSDVSTKNITELAKAKLPALERLELRCDIYSQAEPRFKAVQALLRSKHLPKLQHLVLDELDLDEDGRLELADYDEEAEPEPDSWVDMIADSPLLRQLRTLELAFKDSPRELPTLIERADVFQHLEALEFWGVRGQTRLAFPTPQSIREALGR